MEGISISEDALAELSSIGYSKTLRYAVQLLSPAAQLAQVNYKPLVDVTVLNEVSSLFSDSSQSAKLLASDTLYYCVGDKHQA